MAAQPADDGEYTTLSVHPEGLKKLQRAIERPKEPTAKLISLMAIKKKAIKSNK